jgi:hypothetical protein
MSERENFSPTERTHQEPSDLQVYHGDFCFFSPTERTHREPSDLQVYRHDDFFFSVPRSKVARVHTEILLATSIDSHAVYPKKINTAECSILLASIGNRTGTQIIS